MAADEVALIQTLQATLTEAAGMAMVAAVVGMAHGMVLGTMVAQAQAAMLAMVLTLMAVVAVVMPLLQVEVVAQVAGIQVPMVYQQVAA
jgi:hypothetical protein